MSSFSITSKWLATKAEANLIEATMADLTIEVADRNVTAFKAEEEESSDFIRLPIYYLAEWLAENWWPLLWEPRKNEDGGAEDNDFVGRHSLIAAQRGFALPGVSMVSNGPYVNVTAKARALPNSDVRFISGGTVTLDRDVIEGHLRGFINSVYQRVGEAGAVGTQLQLAWDSVLQTEDQALDYCRMMGALGLSPYAENAEVDIILDEFCERLGEALTLDLCLVGRPDDLRTAAHVATLAVSAAHQAPEIDLRPIEKLVRPQESRSLVAWRSGKQAADAIRAKFGLSSKDPDASSKIFDELGIDTKKKASIGTQDFQPEGAAIVGAVLRRGNTARISCIQRHESQRRFAAARALYSAWTSRPNGGHLLTQAVTRHQQANRAFAAELLAPFEYIKDFARNGILKQNSIASMAADLNVNEDVVFKQAENNGLIISSRNYAS